MTAKGEQMTANLNQFDTKFYEKKALDDLIVCTNNEKDYLTLAEIQQYLPISRITCGRYMNELSEKSPGICGKAIIVVKDGRRIVSYFGFKLKDNHGLTNIRPEQVAEIKKEEIAVEEVKLKKSEYELIHKDFEGRDIQKSEPRSERFICTETIMHFIMYKGYKMGFPHKENLRDKSYAREKGWLIVNKYMIRDGEGYMSRLEGNEPKYIQEIWERAFNGVY